MRAGRLTQYFQSGIPDRQSLLLVFGTATFLTYTWTIFVSFWKIPSWIFFLTISQIASLYAYSFLVNLFESILLTAIMVMLRLILPGQWWKVDFVPLSVVTLIGIVTALVLHSRTYSDPAVRTEFVASQVMWFSRVLLSLGVVAILFQKVNFLKRLAENFAERAQVFLYLYLPLTALSAAIAIGRSLP